MNHIELNGELREFCKQLINDGFKKSQICMYLLGQQKVPMFTDFLDNEDRNFGIKVLSNIFGQFGYDLKLVPVPKDNIDPDTQQYYQEIYNEFCKQYRSLLLENLENNSGEVPQLPKTGAVAEAISSLATELFESLEDD